MLEVDQVEYIIDNQEVILRALKFYRDNQSFPKRKPVELEHGIMLC